MVWFTKKPAHQAPPPPVAATQEHNNLSPGESIAQGEAIPAQPKRHEIHKARADAFEALGIPDIAPPPGNGIITHPDTPHGRPMKPPPLPKPETQTLQTRINAIADDEALTLARMQSDMRIEQHAASLNQNAEINLALAPQVSYARAADTLNEDEVIQMLERGYLQIEIARYFNVSPTAFRRYLSAPPARFARAQEASEIAGEAWDAKAAEVLRTAQPGSENKARSIAAFLQWRAEAKTQGYKRKQGLEVSGGLTIQHEAPERPAITDMISEALRSVTPPPKQIDIDLD